MKQLATVLCLGALTTGAFAQGLINFLNTSSTLSSAQIAGQTPATSGPVGGWYYGLLIGVGNHADTFSFTGVYATNIATAGRFFGGTSVQVPGWAAGTATNYAVAVWSSTFNHNFNPAWLQNSFPGVYGEVYFGISSIATGVSGGAGSPAAPPYNLFGGATGIQTGFTAVDVSQLVPEPSSMALGVLGAAALLIFRRGGARRNGEPQGGGITDCRYEPEQLAAGDSGFRCAVIPEPLARSARARTFGRRTESTT